ncbi:hypothetical protein EVG20_g11466 [Dentipellis fragilis]|uniref:Uncharacterized protein n=1 Tax=Dentipellis fragilis TaxID=205917 RepID=A0A4Y9XKN5_9AGAM|nr:hypothetical protein EVG20_g11466 [Dentipellis fragilis]
MQGRADALWEHSRFPAWRFRGGLHLRIRNVGSASAMRRPQYYYRTNFARLSVPRARRQHHAQPSATDTVLGLGISAMSLALVLSRNSASGRRGERANEPVAHIPTMPMSLSSMSSAANYQSPTNAWTDTVIITGTVSKHCTAPPAEGALNTLHTVILSIEPELPSCFMQYSSGLVYQSSVLLMLQSPTSELGFGPCTTTTINT